MKLAEEIDRLCDAFEAQWSRAPRPQIESFLQQILPSRRSVLLHELIAIELQLRIAAGDRATVQEYSRRFMGEVDAERIAALLEETPWDGNEQQRVIREALLSCPTLSRLTPAAIRSLAERLRVTHFNPGDVLLRQGSPAEALYILLDGQVSVTLSDSNQERLLDDCGPGAVLGEMSLLTGRPCTAEVQASQTVRALTLSAADFAALRVDFPELEIALSQLVGDRLGGRDVDALCGKQIGDFVLTECLGRGGMGVVYAAHHAETGERAALKMLRHGLVHDSRAVERFRSEARMLTAIRHPKIVAVDDLLVAYNTMFLVMELCQGTDLATVLQLSGPLPEPQVRNLLGQVAQALLYAHGQQIVHLDLKPSNILITHDGNAKLADFGLARMLSNKDESNVLAGTPQYMPPEQLSALAVGPASDWYALASVVYELLAGKPLFDQWDLIELAYRKPTWRPPDPWTELPASDEMRKLLASALHPLPEARTLDLEKIAAWAGPFEPL